MTVLKNIKQELSSFRLRLLAAAAFVLFCLALLSLRLIYLQIWQHDSLFERGESNRVSVVPIVPNRGLIKDRNGVVLASNYSAYTLEVTPSKVPELEATIEAALLVLPEHLWKAALELHGNALAHREADLASALAERQRALEGVDVLAFRAEAFAFQHGVLTLKQHP